MSKTINVNPGQYKVKGRERQGEDVVQDQNKAQFSKARSSAPAKRRGTKKR